MIKLEEIVGYLPYGLKIECHSEYEIKKEGSYISEMVEISKTGVTDNYGNNWNLEIKPILRPLSDLTKEIEVNGEKFVPTTEYSYLRFEEISTFKSGCNALQFIQVRELNLLYEMHFDIHNLIERGLAIDINTLEK